MIKIRQMMENAIANHFLIVLELGTRQSSANPPVYSSNIWSLPDHGRMGTFCPVRPACTCKIRRACMASICIMLGALRLDAHGNILFRHRYVHSCTLNHDDSRTYSRTVWNTVDASCSASGWPAWSRRHPHFHSVVQDRPAVYLIIQLFAN